MADEKRSNEDLDAVDKRLREEQTRDQSNKSEWMRDQVGEDHNLSGSSTYRTLPEQPEGEQPDLDSGDADAKDRQSNR